MLKNIFIFLALAQISSQAFAVTECNASISAIWTEDTGTVLASFNAAPTAYFPISVGQKNQLALLLTALSADKTVTVRYQQDGVPCNNTQPSRSDAVGVWIVH